MIRKLLPILALSLWFAAGNANEDDTAQNDSLISMSNTKTKGDCAPVKKPCEPPCIPPPRCEVMSSPCLMKVCSPCYGFYATADFLFWRSENNGFTYGFNEFVQNGPLGAADVVQGVSGEFLQIDGEWDPGFRVGLGWNTNHDNWDLFVNYTWFYGDGDDHHHRSDVNQFPAAAALAFALPGIVDLNPGGLGLPFLDAKANWNVHLNVGDFEIGRGLFMTKTVAIRPHWGVRAAWIDQDFRDHFFNVTVNPNPLAVAFTEIKDSADSDYWGVGPRAGVNTEWHFWCGFSLIGKASAALLYGKERLNHSTHVHLLEAGADQGFFELADLDNDYWQLVPTLQLLLGLQWTSCLSCDRYYFHVNLAWEANYWWNQYNMPSSTSCPSPCARGTHSFVVPSANDGNNMLSMEGLTLNFEFDY